MRRRYWWTIAAAALPAGIAQAAPPAATWGNVPEVALHAPADQAGGWGADGWRAATAVPLPPGHPAVAAIDGAPDLPPGHPPIDTLPPGHPPIAVRPAYPAAINGPRFAPASPQAYGAPARGSRLSGYFLRPDYAVADWAGYGLSPPAPGEAWVRYYDGAALIDGQGIVRDYRGGMNWGTGPRDFGAGYVRGWEDGFGEGADYAEDAVTYRGRWRHGRSLPPLAPYAPQWGAGGYAPGWAGGATVVQGPTTVTTTTVVDEVSYGAAGRTIAYRRPARARRVHRAAPACIRR